MMAHIQFKTAQAVSDTIIALLEPFAHCVHTLTIDNDKEFAQHQRTGHRVSHAPAQSPSKKMPVIQNPSKGLYETATVLSTSGCTSILKPPGIIRPTCVTLDS
jgi:hypothetical protein